MLTRSLGHSGIPVTPLILGTWQAGKRGWVGVDEVDLIRTVQAALDQGITTLDTAEIYGDGASETLVGRALAGRRQEVVLATKVFANHLRPDQVIQACDDSLKRLQTDWIDLYQIHWPAGTWGSEVVPIEDTLGALLQLKQQGKIRAIGVSNFSLAQLQAAVACGPVDSLQPPYSLFWRFIERDLHPYCLEQGITVLAYSPLAQGLLTGRFGPDHVFPEGDVRRLNKLFQGEIYTQAQIVLAGLRQIADEKGITVGQLALAWVMAQPQTCAIAGARIPEQVVENRRAVDVTLTAADLEAMDGLSQPVVTRLDENPVMWNF
ncbi:MAG: aldo/keto reductase [Gloeomargaritaceae cyanobacterium C42_A2020_066]|nr:aldo/keto reductase [Gloeomargaritaceae cyanobacterium C42_A2020_066]